MIVTGRNAARGASTVTAIAGAGGEAEFVQADLSRENDCVLLVEAALARFAALTVLVNNAVAHTEGAGRGAVTEVSAEAFERTLRVNLLGPALLCKLAIPRMLDAGHGSIVNISSRAAERGTPGTAAYTASKGALNALTRSITADFARRGIRCNTVQPGYVVHERRDADMSHEARGAREAMHLTRLPTATDVALAALFLACSESEVITGVTLPVDGGSSAVRGKTLG